MSRLLRLLDRVDVFFVGLHCPLAELERRELQRGDRRAGEARQDHGVVHNACTYDIEVDSTGPVEGNVDAVLLAWRSRTRPSAFDRMRAREARAGRVVLAAIDPAASGAPGGAGGGHGNRDFPPTRRRGRRRIAVGARAERKGALGLRAGATRRVASGPAGLRRVADDSSRLRRRARRAGGWLLFADPLPRDMGTRPSVDSAPIHEARSGSRAPRTRDPCRCRGGRRHPLPSTPTRTPRRSIWPAARGVSEWLPLPSRASRIAFVLSSSWPSRAPAVGRRGRRGGRRSTGRRAAASLRRRGFTKPPKALSCFAAVLDTTTAE